MIVSCELDEVIVIGYGSQKLSISGAVSTVNADAIEVFQELRTLQGQASGINIISMVRQDLNLLF